jgi:hypothetical protein
MHACPLLPRQVLKTVSKAFKGKLVFVTSNSDSSDSEPITKFFGLAGQEGPVVSSRVHFLHFLRKERCMRGEGGERVGEGHIHRVLRPGRARGPCVEQDGGLKGRRPHTAFAHTLS